MPYEWLPISELDPQRGSFPAEVQFPDNSVVPVTSENISRPSWRGLLVKVVCWLWKNGHLRESHCPIQTPRSRTRYVVHTEPVHPYSRTERGFTAHKRVGPLSVETNSNPEGIAHACRTVIEHVGQDPAQFKVWFSPPKT